MVDFTLTSNQILLSIINTQKNTYLAESDVEFINLVTTSGDYNTQVTCNATDSGDYRDSATISYNRINIAKTFTYPIVYMTLGNVQTSLDLMNRINAQFGRSLTSADINVEDITITQVSETIGMATLKMNQNSLVYLGSLNVYFGAASDIADWLRSPVFEYNADASSFKISGSAYWTETSLLPANQVQIVPTSNDQGVQLDNTGALSTFQTYPVTNKIIARIQNQQLVEILGPSGETSYDKDGALLADLPILPPDFDDLMEEFSYTGALNSGQMIFSTPYNVSKQWMPSGQGYYVDPVNGANTNEGTQSSPLKTLDGALSRTPTANYIVLLSTGNYTLNSSLSGRNIGIICNDSTPAIITGAYQNITWTKTSNAGVWSTLLPGDIAGIVDYNVLTTNGEPTRFTQSTNVTGLIGNNAKFYNDGTTLYLITADGRQPDDKVKVIQKGSGINVKGSGSLFLNNVALNDTDTGFTADATAVDSYPTCYLESVQVNLTCQGPCVGSYGAVLYLQNVIGQYGYAGGSFYGSDRQTIAVGASSQFLEVDCQFSISVAAGNGNCYGSQSSGGAVGIRFNCTYKTINGIIVNDTGAGTITANFGVYAENNLVTTKSGSALFNCGISSGGDTGRAVQMILSSLSTNPNGFTFTTNGQSEIHLYNTPVGALGQYGLPTPYRFIYSSLGN